jgi:hypothetical protein
MYIGSIGHNTCCNGFLFHWEGMAVLFLLFIAAHAIGQGSYLGFYREIFQIT